MPYAAFHLLWLDDRRRTDPVDRGHHSLHVRGRSFRNPGWFGHPESSRGHSGHRLGRVSFGFSSERPDLSGGEHSGRPALDFRSGLGPLLHRHCPRRADAGRGMAGDVVERSGDRLHGPSAVRCGMARCAPHAIELLRIKPMQTNFWSRLGALIRKEFNQIRRDRRLAMSLIVPPTLQLLLFGFALDSTVSNLRLGVLDDARSPESRELSAVMTQSKSFRLAGTYSSAGELG